MDYEVDCERDTCLFRPRRGGPDVELPLDPMHVTIGVAPAAGEVLASITPGAHGRNMYPPEIRAGVTAYFGVNVSGRPGVHWRRGTACGARARSAHRGRGGDAHGRGRRPDKGAAAWRGHYWRPTSSPCRGARPGRLGAYRVSQQDPVTWASELTGWAVLDACQLVSQVGLAPTGNLVDTNVTMLAKLPKRYLGGAGPAGGMHGRLRETAAAYLRQR